MTTLQAISPFSDERALIGALKATGSNDPDILHSVLAPCATFMKVLTIVGYILIGCGILLCLLIITAVIGIPMAIAGWWLQRKMKKQKRMFDSTFKAFCAQNGVPLKAA